MAILGEAGAGAGAGGPSGGEDIVPEDAWGVISSYFEDKGLVRQQLDRCDARPLRARAPPPAPPAPPSQERARPLRARTMSL